MPDVSVMVVGRDERTVIPNAKYKIEADHDLCIYRGRTIETGTVLGYFAAGQWQFVEEVR